MAKNIYRRRNMDFRFLTCSLLATFIFVGCDNKKNIETSKQENDPNIQVNNNHVELEPVAPNAQQVCSDTLSNSIATTLVNQIQQKSLTYAMSQAQSVKINLNLKKVKQLADKVVVQVNNVNPTNAKADDGFIACQAGLNITIPKNDIARADQMYANAKEQTFKQRLQVANLILDDNKITDDNFNFIVNAGSDNPQIGIAQEIKLISLVSNVIANSVVKSQIDASIAARKAAISKRQSEQRAAREAKLKEEREEARKIEAQKVAQRLAQRNKGFIKAEEEPEPMAFQPLPTNAKKLSLETDGLPLDAKPKTIQTETLEKPFVAKTPVETKKTQQESSGTGTSESRFNVQGSDDIDVVIIEEEGTY